MFCYDRPQVVQNRAQRAFLGTHRYVSNGAMNGDMGWVTAGVRRKLNIISLWARLETTEQMLMDKIISQWIKDLN